MASSPDYKFRIWVKIMAVAELIFFSTVLLFTLCMPLLIIGSHFGWGLGKQFLEIVSGSLVSLPFFGFLQQDVDPGSVTAILLLTVLVLLLYLIQTLVSLSLVRGCSKELLLPPAAKALQLVRVWRNWTLVLFALNTLDNAHQGKLLNPYYLMDIGIMIVKFSLVVLFINEIKERVRAEAGTGKGDSRREKRENCDDDDTKV